MVKISFTKLVAALGGLALSMSTAIGVASADPGVDALVNTTCQYDQVVQALPAVSPDLANQLASSPLAQSQLRRFLASPPDQRLRTIQQLQGTRWGQQYRDALVAVANSC
jgi:hemophore-related protein